MVPEQRSSSFFYVAVSLSPDREEHRHAISFAVKDHPELRAFGPAAKILSLPSRRRSRRGGGDGSEI